MIKFASQVVISTLESRFHCCRTEVGISGLCVRARFTWSFYSKDKKHCSDEQFIVWALGGGGCQMVGEAGVDACRLAALYLHIHGENCFAVLYCIWN